MAEPAEPEAPKRARSRKPAVPAGAERAEKPATRFSKGRSGNPAGLPKGSRNRIGEAFLAELQAGFFMEAS